ncbi:hypothetical protein D3C81_859540 [compost metagenome]
MQRIDADIDQQQDLFGDARLQQAHFTDRLQRQRKTVLQTGQQVAQLELVQVADPGMKRQARAAVDDTVAVRPGEQLQQLAAAFDRAEMLPFMYPEITVVQAPVVAAGLLAVGRLDQRQGVFGEVRGDARIDHFDLAGAALEGGIQTAAQYIEIALVGAADGVLVLGKLNEEAVAVVQFGHQLTALDGHLADLPQAATVEQRQLPLVPAPRFYQPLQQLPLPAIGARAAQAAQLLVDLQVQAAPHQFQARGLATLLQIVFDAPIDHHVGVELVEIESVGEHRLFIVQAQAAPGGVLAGVGFGEQQFQQRLVRRVDAFEQLPQPGPDELAWRYVGQIAEVEDVLLTDEALAQQRLGVGVIVVLLVDRHQPPQWGTPGQPDGGTVELVEQQVVLGGAAVVRAELAIASALGEGLCVDQEKVRFGAQAGGPGFEQLAFAPQFVELHIL